MNKNLVLSKYIRKRAFLKASFRLPKAWSSSAVGQQNALVALVFLVYPFIFNAVSGVIRSILRFYKGFARQAYLGIDNLSYPIKPKKISRSLRESGKYKVVIALSFSFKVESPRALIYQPSRLINGQLRKVFFRLRLKRRSRNKVNSLRRYTRYSSRFLEKPIMLSTQALAKSLYG